MIWAHTTGFPKCGNHALVKALQLIGIPVPGGIGAEVRHIPWVEEAAYRDAPRLIVTRDPRPAIVSWLRMKEQPVTPGTVITRLRQWSPDVPGESLPEGLAHYEGWLTDPSTLVVRYEALIASDAEMRRIAAWLGVPYHAGAFDQLPGGTRTWNAVHSDHRPVWTPDVEDAWQALGGADVLKRWGYA